MSLDTTALIRRLPASVVRTDETFSLPVDNGPFPATLAANLLLLVLALPLPLATLLIPSPPPLWALLMLCSRLRWSASSAALLVSSSCGGEGEAQGEGCVGDVFQHGY